MLSIQITKDWVKIETDMDFNSQEKEILQSKVHPNEKSYFSNFIGRDNRPPQVVEAERKKAYQKRYYQKRKEERLREQRMKEPLSGNVSFSS